MKPFLLIARKNGRSATRRQRAFPTEADVDRAVTRWRGHGFNTWWVFGPHGADGTRPTLRQWTDEAKESEA